MRGEKKVYLEESEDTDRKTRNYNGAGQKDHNIGKSEKVTPEPRKQCPSADPGQPDMSAAPGRNSVSHWTNSDP